MPPINNTLESLLAEFDEKPIINARIFDTLTQEQRGAMMEEFADIRLFLIDNYQKDSTPLPELENTNPNTLAELLQQFNENHAPLLRARLVGFPSCIDKELIDIKSFISHVWQVAVEECKRVSLESVPKMIADASEYPDGFNDCRDQTIASLEESFKKLL